MDSCPITHPVSRVIAASVDGATSAGMSAAPTAAISEDSIRNSCHPMV